MIATSSSSDQTSEAISVSGKVTSALNLGQTQLISDDTSRSLTIQNKYGSANISMFADSVNISAPTVNIGDYNLKATADGLMLCKFGQDCVPLWKAQHAPV